MDILMAEKWATLPRNILFHQLPMISLVAAYFDNITANGD